MLHYSIDFTEEEREGRYGPGDAKRVTGMRCRASAVRLSVIPCLTFQKLSSNFPCLERNRANACATRVSIDVGKPLGDAAIRKDCGDSMSVRVRGPSLPCHSISGSAVSPALSRQLVASTY
jgi:hypothetical protein